MIFKFFRGKNANRGTSVAIKEGWAVVISKIVNSEIRQTIFSAIREAFRLSEEEISHILENAPIILLDDLNQKAAEDLKDYFQVTGAEIYLTDDPVNKSKCCRTIWPELPDLSFLTNPEPGFEEPHFFKNVTDDFIPPPPVSPLETEEQEKLNEEPKLRVTDSAFILPEQTPKKEPLTSEERMGARSRDEESQHDREIEEVCKQIEQVKEESRTLKESIDQTFQILNDRESDVTQEQHALGKIEKKYEMLRDDFGLFSKEFDGRYQNYFSRLEGLESESSKSIEKMKTLEDLKRHLQFSIYQLYENYEKSQKDHLEARHELQKKVDESNEQMEGWKAEYAELARKIEDLKQFKQELEALFEERKKKFSELEGSHSRMRLQFEEKLCEAAGEIERWKQQAVLMAEKAGEIERSRKILEDVIVEQKEKLRKLQADGGRPEETSGKSQSEKPRPEGRDREKNMSEKLSILEKMQAQVIADLQERLKREALWESKAESLNQTIDQLRQEQAEIQKRLLDRRKKKKS